jgi:hypothetical protein
MITAGMSSPASTLRLLLLIASASSCQLPRPGLVNPVGKPAPRGSRAAGQREIPLQRPAARLVRQRALRPAWLAPSARPA